MVNLDTMQIHVALLGEGTDVWRPVQAVWVRGEVFRIVSENANPEDEQWEFSTGELVRCILREFSGGEHGFVAVERVLNQVPN